MGRIITLLDQKNHYLEKFYSLNEEELERISVGDFSGLEIFYGSRESILDTLKYLDQEIANEPSNAEPLSEDLKKELRVSFAIKEEYVARIVQQDLLILETIETAKSNIIRELQEVKKSRQAVGKYRSPSFTNRFSEKA